MTFGIALTAAFIVMVIAAVSVTALYVAESIQELRNESDRWGLAFMIIGSPAILAALPAILIIWTAQHSYTLLNTANTDSETVDQQMTEQTDEETETLTNRS